MVAISMKGVNVNANLVTPAGTYIVTLSNIRDQKTRDKTKDMAVFETVIADIEDTDADETDDLLGKKIVRFFVLEPENLWALKRALIAFNASEEFVEGDFDTSELTELYGKQARAIVTVRDSVENGKTVQRNNVEFEAYED